MYPAFWVACTFTFLVMRLFGPSYHGPGWMPALDAPVRGYLYNMTMLQAFFGYKDLDAVYWTLTYEIAFYFLISLLIAFKWLKHIMLVLAVWLIYCVLAGPSIGNSPFPFLLIPAYAPFFIAGMVFYLLQTNQAASWKLYTLLLVAFALSAHRVFIEAAARTERYHQLHSSTVVISALVITYAIFWLIIKRKINLGESIWLKRAGIVTYPLYLLHENTGYIALQRLNGRVDKHVLLFGLVAIGLLLAYLIHTLVERRFSKVLGQQVQRLLTKA